MKFSTRTTYALRALTRLARQQSQSVSLATIAKSERLPLKYLEAIFADLKKAGVVKSTQGARGGYRLVKKPNSLSVLTVVAALENPTETLYCLSEQGKKYCASGCACGVKVVVNKLNKSIADTLKQIKLNQLIS